MRMPTSKIEHAVVADKHTLGAWRVEAIDFEGEGACYIAVFTGPFSRERAEEYAEWKNNGKVLFRDSGPYQSDTR